MFEPAEGPQEKHVAVVYRKAFDRLAHIKSQLQVCVMHRFHVSRRLEWGTTFRAAPVGEQIGRYKRYAESRKATVAK
jgi:hypothetical protein